MDKNQRTIEEEKMNLEKDLFKVKDPKNGNQSLRPFTIQKYMERVRKMEDDLEEYPLRFVYDNQNNTDFVEFLKNSYSTNAQNYLSVIITIFTKISKYKKMLKPKTIERMRATMKEGINAAEERAYANTKNQSLNVTFKEYVDAVQNLDTKKFTDTEILLLRLYTEIQARDNFGKLLIWPDDNDLESDKNYYIMDKGKIVLNDYKRVKTHGKRVYTISRDLKKFVDVMIENMNKGTNVNQEYLIARKNGNMYAKGELSTHYRKLTNKLLGKNININDIRRAKISDVLGKKSTTMEDRKKLAYNMMNSLKMQTDVYNRTN
mgnify:CR=1 FL=1